MPEQPMPTPNGGPSIQALVRADLEEREKLGIARYRTPLQAWNGRNAAQDAYEEVLDLAPYFKQVLIEYDAMRKMLDAAAGVLEREARVLGELNRLEVENAELRQRLAERDGA